MTVIPKIAVQRLQAIAKLGEHPDPNLLGAFIERSLVARERVQVLEHLSSCTSCREIVSLSGIEQGVTDALSAVPASRGWLSVPALRWGVAVACVVVVGAVVVLGPHHESRQAAKLAELKPAVQLPVPDGAIEMEKKVVASAVPNAESKTALANQQNASPGKLAGANPADGNRAAGTSSPIEMADARSGAPLAEKVPGRAKDAPAEPQAARAERVIGGSLVKNKGMPAAMGAPNTVSDALIPEDLVPRWTLSSDGTLERSLDSGRSWQTIPVSLQTTFRALAANGLDIWVGGSEGALFHSSDAGRQWTQVRPAVKGEALEDDIIGVEFTDTLHGKLTTAVGETWTTSDAGQAWQKQ
jgi:hypothetical protein